MNAGKTLQRARRRAGLSQRRLADLTRIAQPTIARIERGLETPRVDTLDRLLLACGERLGTGPRLSQGVDRTLIRWTLAMTPEERLNAVERTGRGFGELFEQARVVRQK